MKLRSEERKKEKKKAKNVFLEIFEFSKFSYLTFGSTFHKIFFLFLSQIQKKRIFLIEIFKETTFLAFFLFLFHLFWPRLQPPFHRKPPHKRRNNTNNHSFKKRSPENRSIPPPKLCLPNHHRQTRPPRFMDGSIQWSSTSSSISRC